MATLFKFLHGNFRDGALVVKRRPDFLVDRFVGQHHVAPHIVLLPAAVQTTNGLFVQLQTPRQRQKHHVTAAVLQVEAVAC